ncbi:hypothetical protein ACFQ1M_17925 [Sungkyunkwania multivorans]|uniref:Glycosyl transferase n=1 Tax=Sungkyunkwania multivorans TaxID=1173618 RepID=A0ABW3D284_9FLAO
MSDTTKFAFTICSNNYLGQANALKRSFLKHNPDFQFTIVLVDKLSEEIDYSIFEPAEVIPVATIKTIDIDELVSRYYIIELNTSIKPSVFKHIINEHPQAEVVYYLDPDLYFYDSLAELNGILKHKTAALTPHILSPIQRDGKKPDENIFLNFGIYNLGFIGVNAKSEEAQRMLDWWEERTIYHGYDRPKIGYFVDQLWMAQAPLFYEDIAILKSYNYNMAPWNLHERHIVEINGDDVLLNDDTKLVFYHFSKIADNDIDVSREYDRFTLNDFPLLKELYTDYKKVLKESRYWEMKSIPIAYPVKIIEKTPQNTNPSLLRRALKRLSSIFSKWGDNV